ncbi:hypothetical protein D3C76_1168800 [compost metagenome]
MNKIVPDPPLAKSRTTTSTAFSNCDAGHPPLFTVSAGITAQDALVHASLYLRCAYDTAFKGLEDANPSGQSLLWSTMHSVEMAKGLVDALLDEVEQTR